MNSLRRPNVLLIFTDQQRFDTLSCNGQKAIDTPNIDALAGRGVNLKNCFVQNPVCAPSRASILSGRYCSALHIGTNGIKFPKDICTLQDILHLNGYETALFGKLHFDPHARRDHRNPTDSYGFDIMRLSDEPGCYDDAYTKWVERRKPGQLLGVRTMLPPAAVIWGKKGYSDVPRNTHEPYVFEADADLTHTAFVTSEVCGYIESHGSRPYFAVAGYYAPHPPLNPPQEYIDRVRTEYLKTPVVSADEKIDPQLAHMSAEDWKKAQTAYLAMVCQIDDGVGEIVETIKRRGELDNTVIIFISDHGEFMGDHGRIQKGMPGHDCITHVPCIISHPGALPCGKDTYELTEMIDIAPTVLDFCGIQTPSFMQGLSLENLMLGKTSRHRESVLTEYFGENGDRQSVIRTQKYKYYINEYGGEILYDLENDPCELTNLIGHSGYESVLSDMRRRMIISIQKAAYQGIEPIDEY